MSTSQKNSQPHLDQFYKSRSTLGDPESAQASGSPGTITPGEDDGRPSGRSAQALHIQDKLAGLGQLAAGIAHELRNPLSTMGTSVYYLSQVLGSKDNQSVHEHLDIMQKEIERSQAIITNLVDFSRRSGSEKQRTNVNNLLEQALSLLAKNLESVSIEMQLGLTSIAQCYVCVDDIKQVFLHLLGNAIDAMPDGGCLKIESFAQDELTVAFRITDNGMGIDPDRLGHIFDPFYSTHKDGRVGLGLSLVHACLERNHGKIEVESVKGQGSEFTITLPIHFEENHVS